MAKVDRVRWSGKQRAGKRPASHYLSCFMHCSLSRSAFARIRRERLAAAALLGLALAPVARAQQSARRVLPPLELRADVIDPRSTKNGTLQAGAGVNIPLGSYARLELDGGAGVTRHADTDQHSGRGDAIARFLLDPFAESPWGLSIGGGMSVLFTDGARTREYLVVVADLEAPRVGGIVPALQLGLGGGLRVGLVARAYRPGRR